ncbi:MAG: DUF4340 domain-containing protein [Alphaproteobacteria bacterium]|nr:DUF4340 domain-containing protein [Alphaproteobacteria bacterium]
MNKKYILGGILFVLTALVILAGVWFYSRYKQEANVRGKYTFSATKDKINYLGNIKMITANGGEFNIHRLPDGSWRFKEAKDYYVNEEMLASFLSMVKNSVIVSVLPVNDTFLQQNNLTEENGIEIKTYDYDGKLLDDIILGKWIPEQQLVMIKDGKNEHYAYAASAANVFSGMPQDWIPYPLLNIKTSEIKSVIINDKKKDYKEFNRLLAHSSAWRELVRVLNFMEYQGLTYKSDLADLPPDVKVRQIDVLLLTGMFYKLTVLNVDNAYWVLISMDAQKVFAKEAINVAANTYRFYADWVFQLMEQQGKVLFNEELIN